MNLISLAAIFFIVWWIVLFAVLPWGVKTQAEAGEAILGTVKSAPVRSNVWKKIAATTIVATIIGFGIWRAGSYYGIHLEWIANRFVLRS